MERVNMINLYLGGSRRMAQKYPDRVFVTDKTDWDYNAQHCKEVIDFLQKVGEPIDGEPSYNDDQAMYFYRLPNNVTVVTRKDLNLYIRAFESVDVDLYCKHYWKSSNELVGKFCKGKTRSYFNKLFKEALK